MPLYVDQIGRKVDISSSPKKIVSLVPSQTELLYHLGLEEEVCGITKFCIHPESWFRSKKRVGGTKQVHLDLVRELRPDLIIANKEENVKEQVETLSAEFPVWVSDINNLDQSLEMILAVGKITGKEEKANEIATTIRQEFSKLASPITEEPTVAYLIWKDPYMTVGHDTFIHEMLGRAGFKNIFAARTRYPQVSMEELAAAKPDLVLLSSEPYPFKEKHIEELKVVLPSSRIMLVDGELFSWYGSRLIHSADYFLQLRKEIISLP